VRRNGLTDSQIDTIQIVSGRPLTPTIPNYDVDVGTRRSSVDRLPAKSGRCYCPCIHLLPNLFPPPLYEAAERLALAATEP
jgi:hypothetical protein